MTANEDEALGRFVRNLELCKGGRRRSCRPSALMMLVGAREFTCLS
jgi:hypothetical protein